MKAIGTRHTGSHQRPAPGGRKTTAALLAATLVITHALCWRATASLRPVSVPLEHQSAGLAAWEGPGRRKRSLEYAEEAQNWTDVRWDGRIAAEDPANPSDPPPPSYIPYLDLYHKVTPGVGLPLLVLWLAFLFAFVGIVASDFFCPNLSTIASRLGMSESVTGVTFLAFGNGSPDVFSTFSAMRVHSGSLAIGELLGAASFITSVVAGTMTLVVPGSTGFKVAKHTFLRDVGFFTIAIAFTLCILIDGRILAWEAAAMVVLYAVYVLIVAVGSWMGARRRRKQEYERKVRSEYADEDLITESYHDDVDLENASDLLSPSRGATPTGTRSHSRHRTPIHSPIQELTEEDLLQYVDMDTSFTISVSSDNPTRPHHHRRNSNASIDPGLHSPANNMRRRAKSSVRPSLYTAVQFKDLVESITPASSERSMISVFGGSGENHFHADIDISSPLIARPHGGLRRALSHAPVMDGTRRRALSSASEESIQTHTEPADAAGLRTAPPRMAPRLPNPQPHRRAISESRPTGWQPPLSPLGSGATPSDESVELEAHWAEDAVGTDSKTPSGPSTPVRSPDENPWESALENTPRPTKVALPKLEIPAWSASPRAISPGETPRQPRGRSNPHQRGPSTVPSILITSDQGGVETVPTSPPIPTPVRVSKRKRTVLILKAIYGALFPSLQQLRSKSILGKAVAVLAVPAILCLNLTLPVVDEEADNCIEIDEKEARAIAEQDFLNKGEYRDDPAAADPDNEEREARAGAGGATGMSVGVRDLAEPVHTEEERIREAAHQRDIHIAHELRQGLGPHLEHDPDSALESGIDLAQVNRGLLRLIPNDDDSDDGLEPPRPPPPMERTLSPPSSPAVIQGAISDSTLLRYLTSVQCLLSPIFVVTALFGPDVEWWYFLIAAGVGVGISVTAFMTLRDRKHQGRIVLCFLGFIVAMVWILTIVNEVVGVLQAFGRIFGLSDAIIGVSIFAIGNSLGDFVANVTIARLGYPVMAISACFGGPMLNILLGIGLSASFMIARTGQPYDVDFSPTLMVSSVGLLIILGVTLVTVPITGFVLTRRWGICLIIAYTATLITNIVVEIKISQG